MKSVFTTAALVLLGFVSAQQSLRPIHELIKKPAHEMISDVNNSNWPTVKFYKDYEVHASLFEYNKATKTLESAHDSTVHAMIDNTNNRMYQYFSGDMTGMGLGDLIVYIDSNLHAFYQKFVQANQCHKIDLPESFSLSETYEKAFDPMYNITEYKGVKTLPWEKDAIEYHAFNVNIGIG